MRDSVFFNYPPRDPVKKRRGKEMKIERNCRQIIPIVTFNTWPGMIYTFTGISG